MASTSDGVFEEVQSWLQENWDPDLTVGEWWELLGNSGWAVPTWPVEWFGKGLGRGDAVVVADELHLRPLDVDHADFGLPRLAGHVVDHVQLAERHHARGRQSLDGV